MGCHPVAVVIYSEDKAVRSSETSTLTYQTTRRHTRPDWTK